MNNKVSDDKKRNLLKKNTLERIQELKVAQSRQRSTSQFNENGDEFDYSSESEGFEKKSAGLFGGQRVEFTVFSNIDYQESQRIPQEIQGLVVQIKQEIDSLKQANNSLMSEIQQIEKTAVMSVSRKAGIYHVRFLEVMLSYMRTLRKKVAEAGTWLEALKSKKKKRGSLFASNSKKKGTQYSLSQELQSARSVM